MKLRRTKIRDFVDRLSGSISIILGNNGTGKTRALTEKYMAYTETEKNIISDTYPIAAKLFARIIKERDIKDQLTNLKLSDKDLEHANILLGKEYLSISYVTYSIGEIVDEYLGASEDSYKDIFGNLFDQNTLEANDCYYYYIEVENSNNLVYDTLEMGVGESQLLAYFIAFTQRKNTHFFIDEPFNYVSVKSAENFVKLLLYSSSVKKNSFTFTTNSLEIIDYLNFYNCPIDYIYKIDVEKVKRMNEREYYNVFEERYSFYNKHKKVIYVEDILIQQFVKDLIPEYTVECIGGSGELTILANMQRLCLEKDDSLIYKFYNNICLLYDGDQLNKVATKLKELPCVFFLPYKDIEKAICIIIKDDKYKSLFDNVNSEIIFSQAAEVAKSNEAHDAYEKIKSILNMTDTMMFKIIKEVFKDALTEMVEKIRSLLQ